MKRLRYLFLAIGIFFLIGLLRQVGLENILRELQSLNITLLPILAISGLWYCCYTQAWRQILFRKRPIRFWPLFRIKMAGEAINCSTPANFLGGDPLRVYLLRRYFPWTHGAASVVIDRTLQSMATFALIIVGATVAFWHIPHIPMNVRYGLPVVLLVVSGFIAFVFAHQRRGLFAFAINFAKRLRLHRHIPDSIIARCNELDAFISEFYHRTPRDFWLALGYHSIARILGMVEMYCIGHLADPNFGVVDALILGALTPVVNLLFSFIPGALGVMEGAYGVTLYLLQLSPALGITIQIIKRVRAGIWIGLGYLFLGSRQLQQWKRKNAEALPETKDHSPAHCST
jgi:glycosyltransferase 2 family protein